MDLRDYDGSLAHSYCGEPAMFLRLASHYTDEVMTLGEAVITEHAQEQMAKREIDETDVRNVLRSPQEVLPERPGRVVAHGMTSTGHLLRVFVDVDRAPPEVVTVYRTSKIQKYRSRP